LAASWLKADPPQWPTYPSISLSPPTLLVSLHFALTSVPPSRAPKLLNQVQSETPHWVIGAIDNKKKNKIIILIIAIIANRLPNNTSGSDEIILIV